MDLEAVKPNFFIVGAPKCGTTSMYEYLRQHPQIFMPPTTKEPHFFGRDLDVAPQMRVTRLDDYLRLFQDAQGFARRGEGTTWYLYSKSAPQELKEFSPDALIIVMLRDPVEVVRSLHWQCVKSTNENLLDLREALRAQEDRRHGRRMPPHVHAPRALLYEEAVDFSAQVQRYFDTFGKERVLVLLFDEFAADPAGAYRRALEFLSVDPDFRPDFTVHNEAKAERNLVIRRYLKKRRGLLRALRQSLPGRTRGRVGAALSHVTGGQIERQPWDPQLREELRERMAPAVARLERTLGRDLSHWRHGLNAGTHSSA